MSGTGIEPITSASPSTRRPSGWSPKIASASTSWTWSCGSSSYIAISSSTTSRSESISGVGRAEQHLREQVEGLLGVRVEEAGVEVRRLLAGRRVDRGAQAVEELGDLDRRVALGALEEQVLEEMRDAGLRRRLVTRSGPDPEPEGHRAHRGHGLGDDPEARVELG